MHQLLCNCKLPACNFLDYNKKSLKKGDKLKFSMISFKKKLLTKITQTKTLT